jgi:hypothetical protein
MDEYRKELLSIINSAKTSIKRGRQNETYVLDSKVFKGMPISKVDLISSITDGHLKQLAYSKGMHLTTLDAVYDDAKQRVAKVARLVGSNRRFLPAEVHDSYFNDVSSVGTLADVGSYDTVTPNLWLSPWEANALYSQKGLAETVINKKSKAILLNGVKIKNKKLSAKQIDEISLNMIRLNMPKIIADAVRDALVYGGDLVFPIFKKDNPATTQLSLEALLRTGVLGKGSIDYLVSLDRWNTVVVPPVNPTHRDFYMPEKYYIPFLGADVHGSRCSRIVTSQQAGFFGMVMTLGWGLSDFVGYARSMLNYKLAAQTLPIMIQQMSIIARTIDIEGILAQEGANALDALQEQNTIRTRETSVNNPIGMDVLGNLQVINRDFSDVHELIKLLRQDFSADANLPEPMLFSSEKGNFSSGDDTQGNLMKQYESVKYIHKDVETQFKNLAKILVIDTLGLSKEVLEALPYTEIHFDVPMVANSTERAQIGLNLAKGFFEYVSGQMPLASAAKIISGYGGDEMSLDSELLDELDTRQREADERTQQKYEKEIELMNAQIEATLNGAKTAATGAKPTLAPVKMSSEKKSGYDRLAQKAHEKTRMPGEKRPEKLSKAKNLQEEAERREEAVKRENNVEEI